jgi:phosphoenolpyruvate synthase/pyruvate phosphate dikinase
MFDFMPDWEDKDEQDEEAEGTEDQFEPDPATVAFLDQQSAAFQENQDEFEATYGFKHECVCAADYAEGNMETVTKCYLKLSEDALDTCARLNFESIFLQGMLEETLRINKLLQDEVGEERVMDILTEEFEGLEDDEDGDEG